MSLNLLISVLSQIVALAKLTLSGSGGRVFGTTWVLAMLPFGKKVLRLPGRVLALKCWRTCRRTGVETLPTTLPKAAIISSGVELLEDLAAARNNWSRRLANAPGLLERRATASVMLPVAIAASTFE